MEAPEIIQVYLAENPILKHVRIEDNYACTGLHFTHPRVTTIQARAGEAWETWNKVDKVGSELV